jgi:hypothetical protein
MWARGAPTSGAIKLQAIEVLAGIWAVSGVDHVVLSAEVDPPGPDVDAKKWDPPVREHRLLNGTTAAIVG